MNSNSARKLGRSTSQLLFYLFFNPSLFMVFFMWTVLSQQSQLLDVVLQQQISLLKQKMCFLTHIGQQVIFGLFYSIFFKTYVEKQYRISLKFIISQIQAKKAFFSILWVIGNKCCFLHHFALKLLKKQVVNSLSLQNGLKTYFSYL